MTLDVDTSAFSSMCNELAALMNAPPEQVLREEIGRVLSKAIENTDAAEASSIIRHSQSTTRSLQSATMYSPKNPGRRHLKGGKVLYNTRWRYPDTLWSSLEAARHRDLARRLAARGLAKRSWYRLGQLINVKVDAPGYVKKAVASTGKIYPEDERATINRSVGKIEFIVENAQPTVNAIGGAQALRRAINGRVQYFLTNIEKGVFDSMDKIVKKYQGVTTHG